MRTRSRCSHGGIVDDLILLAQEVVELEGIRESGYRLVFNIGVDGQMSVPHLHMHVLGDDEWSGHRDDL